MKKMTVFALVMMALPLSAMALDELDPVAQKSVPQGVIVRENADGSREMFKGTLSQAGRSDVNVAAVETLNFLDEKNKVPFRAEVDRDSSRESWCWGGVYYTYPVYYASWVSFPTTYYPYYPYGYSCGYSTCYYYEYSYVRR